MFKSRLLYSASLFFLSSSPLFAGSIQHLPNVLIPKSPFTATGVMSERSMSKYPDTLVYNVETGDYEGIKYRVDYAYANGEFANVNPQSLEGLTDTWNVSCSKDSMTDAVSCLVLRGNMFIHYSRKQGYRVSVGLDHYPGYSASVRVGSGKPYTTTNEGSFSPVVSVKILEEMKKASLVRTRYVEWPYSEAKDGEANLYGLSAVLAYMKWAVANYR